MLLLDLHAAAAGVAVTLVTDTPAAHGLIHAAGFYSCDEEFVRTFAPFCREGVERGEPTVVRLEQHKTALLRSTLDERHEVVFLGTDGQYEHPPGAFSVVFDLVREHADGPGKPLRLLGELPALVGLGRDAWMRYEAAVNQVLRHMPVHALCAYDTRATHEVIQDQVRRTHPVIAAADGRRHPSPAYEPPETFIANREQPVCDPLEAGPPALELRNPTPARTRATLRALARDTHLDPDERDNLLAAASEVVTNALLHGRPPVVVRAWGRPGRVVIAVRDAGDGPRDPFAGLVPVDARERESGLGLWITHQLCPEASLSGTDGFTVRLATGRSHAPAFAP